MEVVKITTNEIANKTRAITLKNYDGSSNKQPFIKCIAVLLTVCKEYGVRYSINENEFFDFIDAIIKRFKE